MFLCDIADFGAKQINVRSYIRYIKGRAIPVKGARRTVMALQDALDDLKTMGAAQGVEGAYLMNPRTGKVGQYVRGERNYVFPFSNIQRPELVNRRLAESRYMLHNHPSTASLGFNDLYGSVKPFVINRNGSVFRATVNWDNPIPSAKPYAHIKNKSSFIQTSYEDLQQSHLYIRNKVRNTLQNFGIPKQHIPLVESHAVNLIHNDFGFTHYRYKITDKDKQIINIYREPIDTLRRSFQNDS